MKPILFITIAAVLLVGCREVHEESSSEEAKPEPSKVKESDTSIHDAANAGNIEIIKEQLAAGVDVNTKGIGGMTPLHRAAREGREAIAEILITKGADINVKSTSGSFKGETPLDEAIKRKRIALVSLLQKNGGKYGSITVAAKVGDIEALRDFLAAGADLSVF
ncbi:MAG: ankyrin repeat domain-containing protein, partial [Verrucomicrobiota bacterium]|nr:ankyrin repeat domain-containing protein [Verrucomicrobiota bacterium]